MQGFLWSTLEPFLLTYPCWCWWTVPILFACSPCIAMSLLSLNYSICIDFFNLFYFFWTNHFLVARPRPRCWRGRGCARLYRFMRFLLVFWELYSNTFQVCIEKHSSHLSHVDLERCISPPSLPSQFEIQWKREKKKNCTITYTTVDFDSPSLLFLNPFFFLSKWMLLCCFFSLFFSEWLFFHVGCSCWKTNRM